LSIDKWLSDSDSEEDKKRKEEMFQRLSKDEVQDLKKKSVHKIVQKKQNDVSAEEQIDDLLEEVLKFKEWLNQRTFIKGDLEKIEIWIRNLYIKMKSKQTNDSAKKTEIKEKYKEVPPDFINEKMRIAINKKLRGTPRTSSDTYYLKKLKSIIKEKLKEAEYYEILRDILEN